MQKLGVVFRVFLGGFGGEGFLMVITTPASTVRIQLVHHRTQDFENVLHCNVFGQKLCVNVFSNSFF